MINVVKSAISGVAMLALTTLGGIGSASAAPCLGAISADASFSCTFSDSNTTELDGQTIFTISWNAGLLQLSVSLAGAPAGATLLGMDAFGFVGTQLDFTALPLAWSLGGGPCPQLDGFSAGGSTFSDCAGNPATGNQLTSFTFQLVDTVLTDATLGLFDVNTKGTSFAAHVKYDAGGSCSAFFGDNNIATKNLATDECTSITHLTPEPSTLLLLGLGLIGLAGFGRSRVGRQG